MCIDMSMLRFWEAWRRRVHSEIWLKLQFYPSTRDLSKITSDLQYSLWHCLNMNFAGISSWYSSSKPIEQHHSRVCLPSHQAKFSPAWQSGLCVSFSGCRGLMSKKSEVVGKLIRPLCKKGMLPHFLGHLNLKTWESSRWWPVTTSH